MSRALSLAVCVCAVAPSALAVDFYISSSTPINTTTTTQTVYSYTLGSGVPTPLHSFNLAQGVISDIESTPAGLFMHTVGSQQVAPNRLYSVDPNTGVPTLIGPTGFNGVEGDLAWNYGTGSLLGIGGTDSFGTQQAYTLSTVTGAGSNFIPITPVPSPFDISGVTFDLAGRCWAINSNINGAPADLLEIDLVTGQALSTRALPVNLRVMLGLTTDRSTGTIYAISGQGRIYEVDTVNAGLTLVDQFALPTNTLTYSGITWVVPSPGALGVFALALGGWSSRRRRACAARPVAG